MSSEEEYREEEEEEEEEEEGASGGHGQQQQQQQQEQEEVTTFLESGKNKAIMDMTNLILNKQHSLFNSTAKIAPMKTSVLIDYGIKVVQTEEKDNNNKGTLNTTSNEFVVVERYYFLCCTGNCQLMNGGFGNKIGISKSSTSRASIHLNEFHGVVSSIGAARLATIRAISRFSPGGGGGGSNRATTASSRKRPRMTRNGISSPAIMKKVRYGYNDLKITVGCCSGRGGGSNRKKRSSNNADGDNDDNNNSTSNSTDSQNKKVYWYNSSIMANYSQYIESMLDTTSSSTTTTTTTQQQQQQQHHYEINFPDITPSTWERMIRYLENPARARKMTATDVLTVVKYYEKYAFEDGLQLCNDVLVDFFREVGGGGNIQTTAPPPPPDVDTFVNALLLVDTMADDHYLEEAKKVGSDSLRTKLNNDGGDSNNPNNTNTNPYGRNIFTIEHVQKLVPLLAKMCSSSSSSDDDNETDGDHQDRRSSPPPPDILATYTAEDITNPLFPKLFMNTSTLWETQMALYRSVPAIQITGLSTTNTTSSSCNINGVYRRDQLSSLHQSYGLQNTTTTTTTGGENSHTGRWGGGTDNMRFYVTKEDGFWAIKGRTLATGGSGGVHFAGAAGGGAGNHDNSSFISKILWKSPCSENLPLPPQHNWHPCDSLARGQHPKIQYLSQKELDGHLNE